MRTTMILIGLLLLTGCASSTDSARSLLDRLEFEEDEYGSFELEGTVDLNPIPMMTTNVHMKLEKHKDKPDEAAE